jgi:hypothetical protein
VSSAVAERSKTRRVEGIAIEPIMLRCCAYEHSGSWVAECIDLDLIVKRKTPEAAAEGLRDAMAGYLKTVIEDGDLKGFVPRPSPLSHRLRYHWFCLKAALLPRRRDFRLLDCSSSQLPVWA